jgi:hypothetical protein
MANKQLSLCLLVALLLRLAFVLAGFPHVEQRWHLREDGDGYGALAQSIRDTGHYDGVIRGPVYPYFVAVLGSPRGVKIAQAMLDVLTGLLVWRLARQMWAVWLWALYPFAIWRVAFINKETLVTFLLIGYVVFQVTAMRDGKIWRWLAAGALLGLLNLCKPTFLLWPLMMIAFVPRRGWLVLAGMAVVVAPWTWHNWRVTGGEFLPVATEVGGVTTYIGNYQPTDGLWEGPGKTNWMAAVEAIRARNAALSAVALDHVYYGEAWAQVRQGPWKAVVMAVRKCGRFWFLSAARREQAASLAIQLVYLALAGIGLWRWGGREKETGVMLALIGYVMLLHALSYSDMRFSLPVMPYVCVLASRTFARRSAAVVTS